MLMNISIVHFVLLAHSSVSFTMLPELNIFDILIIILKNKLDLIYLI